jgi:hypothetical protein
VTSKVASLGLPWYGRLNLQTAGLVVAVPTWLFHISVNAVFYVSITQLTQGKSEQGILPRFRVSKIVYDKFAVLIVLVVMKCAQSVLKDAGSRW